MQPIGTLLSSQPPATDKGSEAIKFSSQLRMPFFKNCFQINFQPTLEYTELYFAMGISKHNMYAFLVSTISPPCHVPLYLIKMHMPWKLRNIVT
jgi:hypothetical protein